MTLLSSKKIIFESSEFLLNCDYVSLPFFWPLQQIFRNLQCLIYLRPCVGESECLTKFMASICIHTRLEAVETSSREQPQFGFQLSRVSIPQKCFRKVQVPESSKSSHSVLPNHTRPWSHQVLVLIIEYQKDSLAVLVSFFYLFKSLFLFSIKKNRQEKKQTKTHTHTQIPYNMETHTLNKL